MAAAVAATDASIVAWRFSSAEEVAATAASIVAWVSGVWVGSVMGVDLPHEPMVIRIAIKSREKEKFFSCWIS